ncbi:MAG TPA: outer membrane beta-barrel protein [Candidatus Acidoferrum sp.]|nr:outer membrane beta-barrel protein [Candidatus Acidoferrum sp.]
MRAFQRSLQGAVVTLVVCAWSNIASPIIHAKDRLTVSRPTKTHSRGPELTEREQLLLERVEQLEHRVAELEAKSSNMVAKGENPPPAPKLTTFASTPAEAPGPAVPDATNLSPGASSVTLAAASVPSRGQQAAQTEHKVPFAFGDFTWMNGQNREKSQPLTNQFGTLSLYLDTYYQVSLNHPKDNTIVGNTSAGRNTEFTVNLMEVGYSTQYKNILGEVSFQIGNTQSLVQDADGSVNRGRNLTTANNKYISEALAGYHFDKWSGINVEAGIFYSYIGLESYLLAENWNYNRSLVSDVTPFYFTGARVQIFPTDKIKIEPWVMNGFQTYGKWNKNSAIGLSSYYRPHEWLAFMASFYYGTDTKDDPGRKRFHHDDSILVRYFNRPGAAGISKMAVSVNNHYGFETGGVDPFPGRKAYMAGTSIANRIWFDHDHYAFTVRGEGFTNPTRYLAPSPTLNGFPNGADNYSLKIWGLTGTFDYMPTDFFTLRSEFISRHSNVPFFAGRGGTTSSDGFITTPVGLFVPDVAKHENRVTFAVNFRM